MRGQHQPTVPERRDSLYNVSVGSGKRKKYPLKGEIMRAFVTILIGLLCLSCIGCGNTARIEEKQGLDDFSFKINYSSGKGPGERAVLGLFSESFQDNLKTKYPPAEWPWVRNARIFLKWSSVEGDKRKGAYDWSAADAEVNAALSLGVNSILITLSLPCPIWAWNPNTPGDNPGMGPPENLKDFGDFCRAVAERYKGIVDYYQILQEPGWDTDSQGAKSGKVYYAGYCDQSYMGMLREGYQAIKQVDPNAYVASGALLDEITRTPQAFRNYELLLAGGNQEFSMKVTSEKDIVAERPMDFNYLNKYIGGDVELGSQEPRKTWDFAESTTREGVREWLTLQNPGDAEAPTTMTFMFSDGTTQQKSVTLPAKSSTTIDVNRAVSLATQCDGVALHSYDYPQWWSWYYDYLRNICAKNGVPGLEIVVTEIGWPNGDPPNFTPEGQRQAIGEVGVGGLIGAGCRKIWIFEDVDIAPGTSGGGDYYGLYNYYGSPYPAWNEYKKWQSSPTFQDYGNKPSHL